VVVDAKFAAPALMMVMNRAKWEALPADLQAIVAKYSTALSDGGAAARESVDLALKKNAGRPADHGHQLQRRASRRTEPRRDACDRGLEGQHGQARSRW
jgi:hypothetical protein